IENISDFEHLQSVLQDFSEQPEEARLAALQEGVDRQENGVDVLEGLLVTDTDRERIDVVRQLAPAMRARTQGLWEIEQQRGANRAEIGVRLATVKDMASGVDERLGNLRRKLEGQERFAKSALFESFAYKTLAERIDNLRSAVRNASTDEGTAKSAVVQAQALLDEFEAAKALVSEKVQQGMMPIREAA